MKYKCKFYRGLYGGIEFKPFFYWGEYFKEVSWLIWTLNIYKEMTDEELGQSVDELCMSDYKKMGK